MYNLLVSSSKHITVTPRKRPSNHFACSCLSDPPSGMLKNVRLHIDLLNND